MKVFSSSQNPGLASPVYLKISVPFSSNLHSCKFSISWYVLPMKNQCPACYYIHPAQHGSAIQMHPILYIRPLHWRGRQKQQPAQHCTAMQDACNYGALKTGMFAAMWERQFSRTLLPNTCKLLFGIRCTLCYKVVCCLRSHRIPINAWAFQLSLAW